MAVEVGTAVVNIIPSAVGFANAVRGELSDMGRVGTDAGKHAVAGFTASFLGGITAMTVVAGTALAGLATAGGGYGLKIAAQNEQAATSFETMLGSADKAATFIQQLKDFAAVTPFDFPGLRTAASSLIAIGIQTDKVIPIMRTLGDVTAGMGTGAEGIQRATVALQQMNAAQRITAEDLWQLRDAGIPVFDLLTAATGKTKEEVTAMATSGKLGRQELEKLMAALETGKGLERFNGLMDKQSQSLLGLASTFKDVMGEELGKAMASGVVAIKKQMPVITDTLKTALASIGPNISALVETGVSSVGELAPLIVPLAGDVAQLAANLGDILLPVIKDLAPSVRPLAQSLAALVQSFAAGLAPAIDRVAPQVADFVRTLMDGLNGALDEVLPPLGDLLAIFGQLLQPIADVAVAIGGWLAKALGEMLRLLTGTAEGLTTGIIDTFAVMAPSMVALGDALRGLLPSLLRLVDALAKGFLQILDSAGPLVSVFIDSLVALAPSLNDILAVVVSLVPFLAGFAGALLDALLPVLQESGPLLVAFARSMAELAPQAAQLFQDVLTVGLVAFRELAPYLTQILALLVPTIPAWLQLQLVMKEVLFNLLLPLLPVLEKLLAAMLPILEHAVVPMVEWLSKLVTSLSQTKGGMIALGAAMGAVFFAKFIAGLVGMVIQGFTTITMLKALTIAMNGAMGYSAASKAGATGLQLIGQTASKAVFGVNLLTIAQTALNVVMSPWFLIPAAIIAVGVALYALYNNFEPFKKLIDSIWESFQLGWEWIQKLFSALWDHDWSKAGEMLSGMGNALKEGAINAWNGVVDFFKGLPAQLGGLFQTYGPVVAEALGNALSVAWEAIKSFAGNLPGWILTALSTLGQILVTAFSAAFNAIVEYGPDLFRNLLMLWGNLNLWILKTLGNLGLLLLGWIKDAGLWVLENIGRGFLAYFNFITDLPKNLLSLLSKGLSFLLEFVALAVLWFIDHAPGILDSINSFVASIPGRILSGLGALGGLLVDAITAAFNWVVESGPGILSGILNWFNELPGKLLGLWAGFAVTMFNFYKGVFQWVVDHGPELIKSAMDFFAELPHKIIDAIAGAASAVGGAVLGFGKTLWNAIAGFLNDKLLHPIRTFKVEFFGRDLTPFEGLDLELDMLARGGPLAAGQPAIVGERGPEIWWPDSAGRVIPNGAAVAAGGGGGNLIIQNMRVMGQDRPADTAFEIRHQMRRVAFFGGVTYATAGAPS